MDVSDFERLTAQADDFQELQREMMGQVLDAVSKQERKAIEMWAKAKGVEVPKLLEEVRPITDLSASATDKGAPAIQLTTKAGSW
jgi:NAD-specific glutamate dehydrogenase